MLNSEVYRQLVVVGLRDLIESRIYRFTEDNGYRYMKHAAEMLSRGEATGLRAMATMEVFPNELQFVLVLNGRDYSSVNDNIAHEQIDGEDFADYIKDVGNAMLLGYPVILEKVEIWKASKGKMRLSNYAKLFFAPAPDKLELMNA